MNTAIGSKKALQANCSVKNVGRTIAWCCGNQDHWWLSAISRRQLNKNQSFSTKDLRSRGDDGVLNIHKVSYIIRICIPPAGTRSAEGGVFSEKGGSLLRAQISPRTSFRRPAANSPRAISELGSALWAILFLASIHADKNFGGVTPFISAGAVMLLPNRVSAELNDSSFRAARAPFND